MAAEARVGSSAVMMMMMMMARLLAHTEEDVDATIAAAKAVFAEI